MEILNDPVVIYIKKIATLGQKWFNKGETTKERKSCIVNSNTKPAKSSTLFKTKNGRYT